MSRNATYCSYCALGEPSGPSPCPWCDEPAQTGSDPSVPEPDPRERAARRELAERFHLGAVTTRADLCITFDATARGSGAAVTLTVCDRVGLEAVPRIEHELQRDLTALKALDHPHLVPLAGFGLAGPIAWLATRALKARSLAATIRDDGAMDLRSCLRMVEQVASTLHYLHRLGTAHGHVGPGTIVLDDAGWAYLTGLAEGRLAAAVARARQAAQNRGSESAWRNADPADDQYGLAATIFETLTGAPPFEEDAPEAARARLQHPPRLDYDRHGLPPGVSHVLRRAMSPRPTYRFPSIIEFVSALTMAGGGGTPPSTVRARTPPRPDQQPVLLVDDGWPLRRWLGIVAVLALLGIGSAPLLRLREARHPNVAVPIPDSPPRAPLQPAPPPAANRAAPTLAPDDHLADGTGLDEPYPSPPTTARREPQSTASAEPARRPPPRQAPPPPAPARRRTVPAAPPQPPGHLFVNSVPWGQLYVDGRLVGNTPEANLAVAPGPHVVRILRDGFTPFERRIRVAPGQEVRLTSIRLEEVVP